ncbi:MAG: coproporphyrinogen dehydrogenase HemZ [Bacillota bacterium]
MKIGLKIAKEYYGPVKGTLNVLLPTEIEIDKAARAKKFDIIVDARLEKLNKGIKVTTKIIGAVNSEDKFSDQIIDREISCSEQDFKKRCRFRFKLSIYRLLCRYLDLEMNSWGILIGVRPTKLGHNLLDQGFSYQQLEEQLKEVYGVQREKRELLINIVRRERKYIPTAKEAQQKISIYLGIPFCPTKCDYCSFASYPVGEYGGYLPDFLKALNYEIKQVGNLVKNLDLDVDTVYIGGGTPTILSAAELSEVIASLKESFAIKQPREFMVEAGRPDTITEAKLKVLKELGVDRISINPQTMNQATLDKIGRDHTVADVVESYQLARTMNFSNINMDLIAGLPGEGIEELKLTLEEVKELQPDSLTVHTLTIKRAAKLRQQDFSAANRDQIDKMLELTKETAARLGLSPYYLYRQKSVMGNFENIGYSKPGRESIYNILMMEEREPVIGLGGGAVTKLVDSTDWSLEREINPKFPEQYINQIEKRTKSKLDKLTILLR